MDESHIPDHLRDLPRICAQDTCKSNKVKWRYYNNKNVNQPRFQCEVCGKYFTLGGTLRRPYGKATNKIQNQTEAESEDAGDEGAESEDAGDEGVETRALNLTRSSRRALSPGPEVIPARVDLPNTSIETSFSTDLGDIREIERRKRGPEEVRDAIKSNLLNSLKILVHVDLEIDNESRERSRAQRDRGEKILQKIKNRVGDHLRRVEVVTIEHVFQAIQTMHAQTEAMDLGRVESSRMLLLEVDSQFIKNHVVEFIPEFRIA